MKDKSIQEEIREDLNAIIGDCLITIGCGGGGCPKAEMQALEAQETCLKEILKYLDSKGVMVVSEKQKLYDADVYIYERLVEE